MILARHAISMIALGTLVCGCDTKPAPNASPAPAAPAGIADGPAPWFVRPTGDGGIDFTHETGHRKRYFMPEISCGGGALIDIDGDGDLDAYLIQAGGWLDDPATRPPNRLFRNDGDGTFTDITEASGTGDRGFGMGVVCGDYDRDGDTDIYVTNLDRNTLLQNDGTGRFTDVTDLAGVGHQGWGSSGAFFDYDRDGDLDLWVCNYLNWAADTEIDCYNSMGSLDYCSPKNYKSPAADVLYRNEGDGTFTDVSREAGLGTSLGNGLGLAVGDFDMDGWLDVFVANDGMKDQLWINRRDGTFVNDALLAGCAVDQDGVEKAGMGVTAADIDDDGDLDLLVCNLYKESDSLYRNDGGSFTDVTSVAGLGAVSRSFTRFGMAWHDFDHDGLLDLYQANGRVELQSQMYVDGRYDEPNLVFRGTAPGRFEEQEPRGGTTEPLYGTSRAAAFGDVDSDGDIDVLVVNRDGPAHLLINESPKQGHWIMFRVLDERGSDALYASVTVQAGPQSITRLVTAAYSYQASNDPRVHVGLGDHDVAIEVTVTWPDGVRESFGDLASDRLHMLRRGQGSAAP